jgi:hypothetical protein
MIFPRTMTIIKRRCTLSSAYVEFISERAFKIEGRLFSLPKTLQYRIE